LMAWQKALGVALPIMATTLADKGKKKERLLLGAVRRNGSASLFARKEEEQIWVRGEGYFC